jgi:hypothetical protein
VPWHCKSLTLSNRVGRLEVFAPGSEMLGPAFFRRLLFHCIAACLCCCANWNFADADAFDDFAKDYPTPYTKNNRVMAFILNFDYGHVDPLMLILQEYVSMCEGTPYASQVTPMT